MALEGVIEGTDFMMSLLRTSRVWEVWPRPLVLQARKPQRSLPELTLAWLGEIRAQQFRVSISLASVLRAKT